MLKIALKQGVEFRMGKGVNWRVVHPDMGARQITLNHGIHGPGREFTQHIHDESEDVIVVLAGRVAVRQGDRYTPLRAGQVAFVPIGEAHGTVNQSDEDAALISFQSPPDMALYRGQRDVAAGQVPRPPANHRSGVQIASLDQGSPCFGRPGDWRNLVAPEKGARQMIVDYIRLAPGQRIEHAGETTETVYVTLEGVGALTPADGAGTGRAQPVAAEDAVFAAPGEAFALSAADGGPGLALVRAQAIA